LARHLKEGSVKEERSLASDKNLMTASASGAVLSAFLASLCCIGPLVFAVLGIGGAGLLVKFEAYRPYFTGLTAALLAAGFYFTYREPKSAAANATEGPSCDCEQPKANRLGRVMLWVATVIVVAFWSFPYIANLWG
jgi:mercuric ion transport protein